MSSSEITTLENFRIPLEEIILGTNNFSEENYLGGGGFGKVYRGTLSESRTVRATAIKRLNPKGGQGKGEFMSELLFLTSCQHKNIIAFVGYCDEGDEMIIAYEYAANKSLDQYLRDTNKMRCITWVQCLLICIDSARGLNHLHWGLGSNHRVIHRDVKSGNILLDDNWVAKISDFGLSKFSPKNQLITQLYTMASGTHGYCDPDYYESNILRKESDVYSFGVVMFELLCGRLVFPKIFKEGDESDDSKTLVVLARCYKDNLYKIIDPHIRDQINSRCLGMYTRIACKCLERKYIKRPTMTDVLETLEQAFSFQKSDLVDPEELLLHYYNKKRRAVHNSESVKRMHLSKVDDGVDSGQLHMIKTEIAKITDKGGLVDFGGVEKLLQLMQPESPKKKINLVCQTMLVDVISSTDRFDCLGRFVQLRGLLVLNKWLEEIRKGKIGDENSKSVEEFLFVLLRALDRLPVNLHALQMCNVGKSVNHLRSHKNSEIQMKARSLVDKWKKCVEAEINVTETKSGTAQGFST